MADSLDDFFAKKDKSKKKGKGRFATTDLMPVAGADSAVGTANPELDDTKKAKKKKDRDQSGPQGTGTTKSSQDDGDWKDYEAEEEKDYTGLRIQTLQSKAESEEAGDDNRETEYTEDGTLIQKRDEAGPWNKGQGGAPGAGPPAAVSDSVDGEEAAPIPQPPASSAVATPAATAAASGESARSTAGAAAASAGAATPGKYVPPSMRGRTGAAASPLAAASPFPGAKTKKKTAPNITSEEDFPSLSVMGTEKPFDVDTTSFEKVRGGGKDRDAGAAAPRLELANKFDALSS